ncbi:MAG: hypothetical protein ACI4M3_07590 [Acutalibacteraceae bacterium]
MNHAYNHDSPLYWAVGRGMLNGIKPYSGLYENKPVGIFLISALSFALTNDITICNLFSFLCLVIIAFIPVLCIWEYCKQTGLTKDKPKTLIYLFLALIMGLFLMKYCETNSGSFQTESIGTAFAGLYFWAIMHIHWKKGEKCNRKQIIIWTTLAGFFVMCSVMFKEPFIILLVSGSLFMVNSVRDFIAKTVIPSFIGGVLSVMLLLACGVLSEYFSIYLKKMFGNHISIYGSPFVRMFQLDKMMVNLEKFSTFFAIIVLLAVITFILYAALNKKFSLKLRLWKVFTLIFALLCASFAVGLGGHYFRHHYIFAAPFYMILIISVCKIIMDCKSIQEHNQFTIPNVISATYNPIVLSNLILLIIFIFNLNIENYRSRDNFYDYSLIYDEAKYVDSLLDYYGEDTYQYIGFNMDNSFYGLTVHSPKGPAFVQDEYNFEDENSWFSQNLLRQLDEVNIVIVNYFNMPAINDKVQEILDTEFTTEPKNPYTEMEKPKGFDCKIYYRIDTL